MKNQAKWIQSPTETGMTPVIFRHAFSPRAAIKKASICVSSLGVYALYCNGTRVGKGVLTPGWTSYRSRVQYQTYDLSALLGDSNTIEIGVGPGWAMSNIGFRLNSHY